MLREWPSENLTPSRSGRYFLQGGGGSRLLTIAQNRSTCSSLDTPNPFKVSGEPLFFHALKGIRSEDRKRGQRKGVTSKKVKKCQKDFLTLLDIFREGKNRQKARAGSWQNGFFADFYFWAAGFFRGFCRRIFSPHFCGKKCPEKSSRKIPGKILQNLYNKNPRHISAEGPNQNKCQQFSCGANFLAPFGGALIRVSRGTFGTWWNILCLGLWVPPLAP